MTQLKIINIQIDLTAINPEWDGTEFFDPERIERDARELLTEDMELYDAELNIIIIPCNEGERGTGNKVIEGNDEQAVNLLWWHLRLKDMEYYSPEAGERTLRWNGRTRRYFDGKFREISSLMAHVLMSTMENVIYEFWWNNDRYEFSGVHNAMALMKRGFNLDGYRLPAFMMEDEEEDGYEYEEEHGNGETDEGRGENDEGVYLLS